MTQPFYEQLQYDIYLKNTGTTTTVDDISATLFPDTTDPCIDRKDAIIREFGDIAPGETKVGLNYVFWMNESCIEDTILTMPFYLNIASEGYVFWNEISNVIVNDIEKTSLDFPKSFAPLK